MKDSEIKKVCANCRFIRSIGCIVNERQVDIIIDIKTCSCDKFIISEFKKANNILYN